MNNRQQIVLWSALIASLLIGAFPPWQHTSEFSVGGTSERSERPAGYAFIGLPPQPIAHQLSANWNPHAKNFGAGVRIDAQRVIIEGALLLLVAGGLLLALKTPARNVTERSSVTGHVAAASEDVADEGTPIGTRSGASHPPRRRRWFKITLPSITTAFVYAWLMAKYTHRPAFDGTDTTTAWFLQELCGCFIFSGALSFCAFFLSGRSQRTATLVFCGLTAIAGLSRLTERLDSVGRGSAAVPMSGRPSVDPDGYLSVQLAPSTDSVTPTPPKPGAEATRQPDDQLDALDLALRETVKDKTNGAK